MIFPMLNKGDSIVIKGGNSMTDVVVEVRGGTVVKVYSERPETRVTVVDWDDLGAGDNRGVIDIQRCISFDHMPTDTQQAFWGRRQFSVVRG